LISGTPRKKKISFEKKRGADDFWKASVIQLMYRIYMLKVNFI
jgi:hypothetical protein